MPTVNSFGMVTDTLKTARSISGSIVGSVSYVMRKLGTAVNTVTVPVVSTMRDDIHKLWYGEASENPKDYEEWAKEGRIGSSLLISAMAFVAKVKLSKTMHASASTLAKSSLGSFALGIGVYFVSHSDERLYRLQACQGMFVNALNFYEAGDHEKAKDKLHELQRKLSELACGGCSLEKDPHRVSIDSLQDQVTAQIEKVTRVISYRENATVNTAFQIAKSLTINSSGEPYLSCNQLLELLNASGKDANKTAELLVLMPYYYECTQGDEYSSAVYTNLFTMGNLSKIQQNAHILVRQVDKIRELSKQGGILDYKLLNFIINHSDDPLYIEEIIKRSKDRDALHFHEFADYLLTSFERFIHFKQNSNDELYLLEERNQKLLPKQHSLHFKKPTTDLQKDKVLSADINAAFQKIKTRIENMQSAKYVEAYVEYDETSYRETTLHVFSEKQIAILEAIAQRFQSLLQKVDKRISRCVLPPEEPLGFSPPP